MNKLKELEKISEEIRRCSVCKEGGTGLPVPGEGSPYARVVFIGEAPGSLEAKTGRPFIGRSGKFLRAVIAEMGLSESDVFITSPVHYRPLAGTPSREIILHGTRHLLKQLRVIHPQIIVLLGNIACRALLGEKVPIAKNHGNVVDQDGTLFFITVHPMFALRFPEGRKKFVKDLSVLERLIREAGIELHREERDQGQRMRSAGT